MTDEEIPIKHDAFSLTAVLLVVAVMCTAMFGAFYDRTHPSTHYQAVEMAP